MAGFITIRARQDNHVFLFFDKSTAFCVDSIVPEAIIHALSCEFSKEYYTVQEIMSLKAVMPRRTLKYAFTTHGHSDHSGGNKKLSELSPETIFIDYSNMIEVETGPFFIKPIHTPNHTLDSVCYAVSRGRMNPAFSVLTGDFLFKLGCGRFFEGNAKMFQESVNRLFDEINDDCVLLYGHDYSEIDRAFTEQFYKVDGCDETFLTASQEKKFNPFLNIGKIPLNVTGDEAKIAVLREMKDVFRQ